MTETTKGGVYAVAAYLIWGLAPLFWRQLADRSPVELLAQRVLWAMPLYLAVLWGVGRLGELRALARPRVAAIFAVSGVLLAINWFTFVYAVTHREVLQASLGYFVNPIVNVLLGLIFLGERLRAGQWLAVAVAAAGVAMLAGQSSEFPWLSLTLALSFGLYGLVRKTAPADAIVGSNLETALLFPFAGLLLAVFYAGSDLAHTVPSDPVTWTLFIFSGAVTALPLLCFSQAARRLTLTSLGFFQYLAPSAQFFLAIWIFGEPFTAVELRAFLAIWTALILFSVEGQFAARRARRFSRSDAGAARQR